MPCDLLFCDFLTAKSLKYLKLEQTGPKTAYAD